VVELPVEQGASTLLTPGARQPMERPRVLIVEDDTTIRDVLAGALEDEGYTAQIVGNGAEALVWLTGRTAELILLDMRTPVLDGWGFARAYRATAGPHAPIVVVSAATDAAQHAEEIGADAFLAKPFPLQDAVDLVRRFVPVGTSG
jgi:CheY-like chemotaxis protein